MKESQRINFRIGISLFGLPPCLHSTTADKYTKGCSIKNIDVEEAAATRELAIVST
ncbi:MAG: hypothetical protein IJ862_02930 [Selenomonadaceae bacterium]|nr:hypothetical protein [Selenomonadaceae bacterium]